MRDEDVFELESKYVMPTYTRQKVVFVRGRGVVLYDSHGREYVDFVAGVAVNCLGHCHPKVVEAICSQARELIHTSNLYYIKPQVELAERLCEISGMEKVFFCNSGTEAVEAAIKLARKTTRRTRFVACEHSFHGRTMGALSITHKESVRKPFEPLLDATFVPYGDEETLKSEVGKDVAAFVVEPIQGEGGVNVPPKEYLKTARDVCDDSGAILIFDEVQSGMGRTGRWFAKEHFGVEPDVMTLGKAIGGGLPLGATLSTRISFETGEHGSTFGGGFIPCRAGLAVIDAIEEGNLIKHCEEIGEYF